MQSNNQPGMSRGVVPNQIDDLGPAVYPNWTQSGNQPGTSNAVVPNQTNVSTAQASPHPNTSKASLLKRNVSSVSEADRERKRKIDQAYRERCKKRREETEQKLEILTDKNESLEKENESLKKDNASMHQTLREQGKEINRLKNDLLQLKSDYEKYNVLVQTFCVGWREIGSKMSKAFEGCKHHCCELP
ncbi:hypothetical protein DITRI_Ditri06bG0009200 [Diplodiscus trichospermus]